MLDAEVLLADPDIIGKHGLLYLPHLKWMQSTFDGNKMSLFPFVRVNYILMISISLILFLLLNSVYTFLPLSQGNSLPID